MDDTFDLFDEIQTEDMLTDPMPDPETDTLPFEAEFARKEIGRPRSTRPSAHEGPDQLALSLTREEA